MVYLDFWKGFCDFSGYSDIKEFWIPFLLNAIISVVLFCVSIYAMAVFCFIIFVPTLASSIRRLRDADMPVFFIIFAFIPGANLYWLYCMVKS